MRYEEDTRNVMMRYKQYTTYTFNSEESNVDNVLNKKDERSKKCNCFR